MSETIRISRTVDASPDKVFAVLADPGRHTEFDGSSMLRGLAEGAPVTAVGDVFIIDMYNDILGDYQIRNTVVAFEKDRTIGWGPALHPADGYTDKIGDMKPGGHTFTWELEPAGQGCTVTQVYDWSGVTDPQFKAMMPLISEAQLGDSVDRVGRACT